MSKSILKTTLVGLASIFLFVACFQIMPISISLGQDDKKMNGKKTFDLQPGELYLVYSDTPFTLYGNAKVMSGEGIGGRLRHDGFGKDKDKKCWGIINMVVMDNGYIKYQCNLCDKKWIRNAEGKLVDSGDRK